VSASAISPRPIPLVASLPASRPFVAPEELARTHGHGEILRLGANESAFGPSPASIEAMRSALPQTSWYGDPESVELRAALARKHGVTAEEIVVGAGIDDLHGLAVRAFIGQGGVAVATAGTYPTFAYHVEGYGGELATVPYRRDGSMQLDKLVDLARERNANVLFLANPDNPSGSAVSDAEVRSAIDALPERTLLVLDEAYREFAPHLREEGVDPRVVRMRTFSKVYGLAGARIGYAIASHEVCGAFNKIRLQYGVNRIAQAGALASLADDSFINEVVSETMVGRVEYYAIGARLGVATLASQTNFVLFDLETRARADAVLAELLRLGVFIRKPGAPPIDRCVRVTVGTEEERGRFAELFATALDKLR